MFGRGKKKEDKVEEVVEVVKVEEPKAPIQEAPNGLLNDDPQDLQESQETVTIQPASSEDEIPSAVITGNDPLEVKDSQEESQEDSQEPAPLTYKEAKALKKSRYETDIANNPKFKKVYVIRNKKTNQIVEVRAASSCHACNIMGWKPNKVQLLSENDVEQQEQQKQQEAKEEPETVSSSAN